MNSKEISWAEHDYVNIPPPPLDTVSVYINTENVLIFTNVNSVSSRKNYLVYLKQLQKRVRKFRS